jgi:hypothetical protein
MRKLGQRNGQGRLLNRRVLQRNTDQPAILRFSMESQLLWHPDIAENIRAAHSLLRQQARLQVGYERRYGKPADTKHLK